MVIAIIGAGVAGLMAAGTAAQAGHKVILLEKKEKTGRKLRITGKGRCNITNTRSAEEFIKKVNSGGEFALYSLEKFSTEDTRKFFESQGVELKVERGDRVFPASDKAWDVANALEKWAIDQGVELRLNSQVITINTKNNRINSITLENGETIECDKVILTTGGVSYPSTGSDGDGHEMSYELGHNIVPLRPALVPLEIESKVANPIALKNVALSLFIDNKLIDTRQGDVEFTKEIGVLSGAITLQFSRQAVDAIIDGHSVMLELDLKPGLAFDKLKARIKRDLEKLREEGFNRTLPLRIYLRQLTPSPLHSTLSAQSGVDLRQAALDINDKELHQLAYDLKHLKLPVRDYRPFSEAIVTAGGVDLEEVDSHTMGSRIINGLYFAGELLDIDADTGGYNIQLALSTGRLAGQLL